MAERDLETLLKTLKIKRHDHVWKFHNIANTESSWADLVSLRNVREIAMLFREDEGLTVITQADEHTDANNRWVWLELCVFSDLQAVGFMAAVSNVLSQQNIPCNTVAAYHHDHVFVPEAQAGKAIAALEALSSKA